MTTENKQTPWGGWRTRITRQGWLCQALGKIERLAQWLGGRPVTSRLTPRQPALSIERFEERITPTVADIANLDAMRMPTVNTDLSWGFNTGSPLPAQGPNHELLATHFATTISTLPQSTTSVTGPGWLLGGSELLQSQSGIIVASSLEAGYPPLEKSGGEIVFVTAELADSVPAVWGKGAEVVVLNPTGDSIRQMTETLLGRKQLSAIHIVSHGSAGTLWLGSQKLDKTLLEARSTEVRGWAASLAPGADLLLYGCDVASTGLGRTFVDELANFTAADVAASINRTGSSTRGGDAVLEYATGVVNTTQAASQADWNLKNIVLPGTAPTLTNITALTGATEDTAYTITFDALAAAADEADADSGDTVSFLIASVSTGTLTKEGVPVTAGLTVLSSGQSLVWTPDANANGTLNAFTVKAWDGTLASDNAIQVQISVTPVYDAPTLSTIATLTGATEGTPYTITYAALAAAADASDADSDPISFRVEAVSTGTLTKNGVAVVAGTTLLSANESLVWIPANNGSALNAFTVKAFDGALASASPVQVTVNVAAVTEFEFSTSINTITITGYTGAGGAVVVPSTIGGLPVVAIGASAFLNKTTITGITIPSSVTSIGNSAFQSCSNLVGIVLPNSVTTLGTNVFYGCSKLASGTLSSSLTAVPSGTFQHCSALTSIVIPSGVVTIGADAFHYCSALTSIVIPDSVTSIGNSAFYFSGLTSITLGSGITSIGTYAFQYCTSLNNVVIPSGVTAIQEGTFFACRSLSNVTIPNTVTSIAAFGFLNTALASVTIPASVTSI
jgi:hypothetical protein